MKAITIVEMLVATAILTALILTAFGIMSSGRAFFYTSEGVAELRQELIKAFAYMEKDLRGTRPAEIDLPINSTSTSLTFRIPQDIDGDGTILDSSGYVEWSNPIIYALNNNAQITRTDSAGTSVLANNALTLTFTRPNYPDNILQVDIGVQKTTMARGTLRDADRIIIKMRN